MSRSVQEVWARRLRHPVRSARNLARQAWEQAAVLADPKKTLRGGSPVLAERFDAALQWVREHRVADAGIQVVSSQAVPYPEVSGYFIPTLLGWGERELAAAFARWLVSIQNTDGSWSDPSGRAPYTFDTGQVLKGLLALVDPHREFEEPIRRGCEWMLGRITPEGRVTTPDKAMWQLDGGRLIPETIHLYALEPLQQAGRRWNEVRYTDAAARALAFYLRDPHLTDFTTLSHFHAYILEALVDLGCGDRAASAMKDVAKLQRSDGAVPAYPDVNWVCSTGLLQYAVVWYKLGEVKRADRAFDYGCTLQHQGGGFFGGYGAGASYFPRSEISWAVKYFLDALWWKIKRSFDTASEQFEEFEEWIAEGDGRYQLIAQAVRGAHPTTVLDIGCGRGRFVKRLQVDFPGLRLSALDLSEQMLRGLPEGIIPMVGTLLHIPAPDESFDLAFCVEALEHAVNIPAAIREMSRVIRKGGTLVVIDKNRERLSTMRTTLWERWFSEEEISRLLRGAGLTAEVHRNIPYDEQDGTDGLFFGWVARKSG